MSNKSTYIDDYTRIEAKRGLSLSTGATHLRLFDSRMLALGRGEYGRLWAVVLLGLFVSFTYILQGLLIALALGKVFAGRPFAETLALGSLAAIIVLIRWGLIWVNDRVAARTATSIAMSLRRRLYTKLMELGPGWMLTRKSGVIQATLVDGAEALQNYYGRFLPQAVVSLIAGTTVVAILFYIDPIIGAVVGTVMVFSLLQPLIIYRGVGPKMRIWFVAMPRLFAEYVDNIQGLVTLKAFNASRRHGEMLFRKTNELFTAEIGVVADEILWGVPPGLIAAVGGAVAIIVGAVRMDAGTLSAGSLLLVLLLVSEALRPVNALRQTIHFSFSGMGAAEGVLDILEARPPVAEPPMSQVPPALEPSIAFEGVTFSYRQDDEPAINRLSFSVRPGEAVALVGRSGSGKTTVASLLLRFFDPQEGSIKVGGKDIRTLPLEKLRSLYAIVSQDTYLFHGTIRENLLFAKPDASQEELEAAAKSAAAHDFIRALPQGYDTLVGERGVKLSGGERQRIAIARALLKDAPILILDEATSSVDIASEALIQEALAGIMKGRTTIVIAHRLSTVRHADRIYVLEKGRLAESGSHGELMATGGTYRGLVRSEEAAL